MAKPREACIALFSQSRFRHSAYALILDCADDEQATMGIDIGKNSFHVVGLDQRGAIVLRRKWSLGQIEVP